MVIVGSKRMIVYDDNQPLEKIKIYDKRVETPPHYDTFAEFQYSYHYGDMYAPTSSRPNRSRWRRSTSSTASRPGRPPIRAAWTGCG